MKTCPFCAEEIQDAAIKCKHCGSLLDQPVAPGGQTTPAPASDGWYPGKTTGSVLVPPKQRTSFVTWVVLGFLILAGIISIVVVDSLTSSPSPQPVAATPARPKALPDSTLAQALADASIPNQGKRSYPPEKIAAARGIMEKVRAGLATLDDDGRNLDVHFAPGLLPSMSREQLYGLMAAIANADAVLTGGARLILFYDPTGKRVGKVSAVSGITIDIQ